MKVWKGKNKNDDVILVWEWLVEGNIYYQWSFNYSDGSGGKGDWNPSYRSAVEEAKGAIREGRKIRMKRVDNVEQSDE